MKYLIDAAPRINRDNRVINVEIEVFIDLVNVSFRAAFETSSNVSDFLIFNRFSLILSNTTIVSCTENPKIVNNAVMKRISISIPNKENIPSVITTS